jgi:SAM-dependent methyltransferase
LTVGFAVAADAYDRFMGRYSAPLAPAFADYASVRPGHRVLDVGCGTGALTAELIDRVGAASVAAVDPSTSFVGAMRARHPDVDVGQGSAEQLPFAGATFDRSLAQLVVHFMADPVAGVTEMARVTVPGGVVAACVWDHAGGGGPLSVLWRAAHELDPGVEDEGRLAGARRGDLARILADAGLRDVEETALSVRIEHPTFEEWWEPYTLGVGPAGVYVASLADDKQAALVERCRTILPAAPFDITAVAWTARGVVPPS